MRLRFNARQILSKGTLMKALLSLARKSSKSVIWLSVSEYFARNWHKSFISLILGLAIAKSTKLALKNATDPSARR